MKDSAVFDIATGVTDGPKTKHWKDSRITWGALREMVMTDSPPTTKESGGYVLGKLLPSRACEACRKKGKDTCLQRNSDAVESRGALVLDADRPAPTFAVDALVELDGTAFLMHTTFSSAPDGERFRLIIPTDRKMSRTEYTKCVRVMMDRLGPKTQFDASSDEPARFMYKPAARNPQWYKAWEGDGEPISVDELLADYREEEQGEVSVSKRRNSPFEYSGVAGTFNRAYRDDFAALVEVYDLPYVSSGDRWQLAGTHGAAGVKEIQDNPGLYWSNHETDPIYRQSVSAFDVVRLHRFAHLDKDAKPKTPLPKLPSYAAMTDLAASDARVLEEQLQDVAADFGEALADHVDVSWTSDLQRQARTQRVLPTEHNMDLIRRNDHVFKLFRYNALKKVIEVSGHLPWRNLSNGGDVVSANDIVRTQLWLEKHYSLKLGKETVSDHIGVAAHDRWYNPVLDYLTHLEWDGVKRLEEAAPVPEHTDYTRVVTRKALVAAVARVFEPGIKWDHTLVLVGPQGVGKTTWVERMARRPEWTATLGRLDDKDTLMKLNQSWIITSDEAHSLRRAESEQQKEFLTRTTDTYRAPYEKAPQVWKRQCVIWGTTNDDVFLRNQEGNRRFLTLRITERMDFLKYEDDSYVDQVWAEAVALYRAGERLYFTAEEQELVQAEVERHVEEDTWTGMVQAYLDDEDNRRDVVCTRELWEQALGHFNEEMPPGVGQELSKRMTKLPDWERPTPPTKKRRMGKYGSQMYFQRKGFVETTAAEDFSDPLI